MTVVFAQAQKRNALRPRDEHGESTQDDLFSLVFLICFRDRSMSTPRAANEPSGHLPRQATDEHQFAKTG